MRLIDTDKLSVTPIDVTDLPKDRCLMCYLEDDVKQAPTVNAIVIPDGATNGDVIELIAKRKPFIDTFGAPYLVFRKDWWNSPYKGGQG